MPTTARSCWRPAPLMSAVDVRRLRLFRLRATVSGTIGSGYRSPGQVHVARVVGVTYLHEYELIDVVVGEAMEVLQEEFQFLVGERFVVSVVSHALTLRLACVPGLLRPCRRSANSALSGIL